MAPNYLVDRPKKHGSVQYYLIALQSQLGSHQFPLSLLINLPIHLGWEHTTSTLNQIKTLVKQELERYRKHPDLILQHSFQVSTLTILSQMGRAYLQTKRNSPSY